MSVPLVREVVGAPDPEDLFDGLAGAPWTVWLDSALEDPASGRYSFLAVDPFRVLRGRSGRAQWLGPGGAERATHDALTELQDSLARHSLAPTEDLPPFCGGAAGMFGYELAADLEAVPPPMCRDLPIPDLEVGLYDLVVGWDRVEKRCWIASTGAPDRGEAAGHRAAARLAGAERWLAGGPPPADHRIRGGAGLDLSKHPGPATHAVPGSPGFRSTFTPTGYHDAVRRAIDWIRAGDIYQVNLSQRFETRSTERPTRLYRRLRSTSPAPYGAFFAGDGYAVLSTSPELFLQLRGSGHVRTRPIKGTRARSEDPGEDLRLARELEWSDKDRAENLMIVDLLRNDLSRVCRPDSVRATDLFRIESFRTVHHLVSTVEGRVREGRSAVDLLRAAFPCGSVTGAPKIRAMEIIAQLEPVARGPYCGALGYLGFGGDMDTAVSIRIAVAAGDQIVFHAGGAVVVDSDPVAEYRETLDKARGIATAVRGAAP